MATSASLSGSIDALSGSFLATSASLNSSISALSSSFLNTSASLSGSIDALSGSFLATSASLNSSISALSSSFLNTSASLSGSIDALSGSFLAATASLSGSISDLSSSFLAATASISSSVGALSSSFLSYTSSNNAQVSSLNSFTSSQLVLNGTYALTSSLNSFTASQLVLNGTYATTASNTFTGNQTIQGTLYNSNTTNATGFTSTAATYTDGGLRVAKDAYISGSTFIAGNLTVFGTSSINYVTASEFIGLEFINLNTDLPSLRYAGINVGDSGSSAGITSSFWYDSQKDNWLAIYANAGITTSSLAIKGPITYNNVGNEVGITPNFLTKGQSGLGPANDHHITSSQISDDGTTVRIPNNLQVTGSLFAGNLTGSLNGSNLVDASVANAKLTNSSVTINGTSLSLGGTLTQAQTIAGAFSGSAQIDHNATTNYVANRHIDHTAVSISAGNGLSGGGDISSTRTISLDTTSATFTNGVKSKLNADGVVSSSAQIDHNATTNYVANRHIDHSAVSISAGSGLTGGGDITTTRTLSIATGGVTNAMLTNSTISGIALGSNLATLTIGTGLSGTSYNGSGAVTIANTGVTSAVAGTAISVSGATGAVTITNTGVTSNVAGTGVSVSGATGAVTISIGQAVGTGANVQFNSLGVGTAGSATAGEIRATNDITAFYSSDERLKENITLIENPIEKLMSIDGVTFNWKEGFDEVHSHKGADTGVIAQQIEAIGLPEVVTTRENGFKAVKYEKLNALLIEGFKQQQVLIQSQQTQIDELKTLVNQLLNK